MYGEVESHCYCEKHRTCERGGNMEKLQAHISLKLGMMTTFEKYYKDYRSQDLLIKDCYDNSTCYDFSADGLP